MSRSPLSFDDTTLAALLGAARDANAAHPHDNPAFLDMFLHAAWQAARRLYGAQTYLRLMAQAGVTRRPSAGTVQKAIVRARAVFEIPPGNLFRVPNGAMSPTWALQLEHNLSQAMQLLDVLPQHDVVTPARPDVGDTSVDAVRRMAQLERENLLLRTQLLQMTVAAACARQALGETLHRVTPAHDIATTSGVLLSVGFDDGAKTPLHDGAGRGGAVLSP